jgi:hypothetical protein
MASQYNRCRFGPVEPLSGEKQTVVSFDSEAGDQGCSYIANIDVADRQGVQAFFQGRPRSCMSP